MLKDVLNKLADREREIEELKKENRYYFRLLLMILLFRTLATIQRRHEKAIGKMESQDDELPAIIARKESEIAVYMKQAKLYKDKWVALDKDLRKYQKQLQVCAITS